MPKEEMMKVEGQVVDVLPNATFRVALVEMGATILGQISGKMRQNDIRVLLGDMVEMELSPYDLTKGRIVRRRQRPSSYAINTSMRVSEVILEFELPKNQWELLISNADKHELGDDLIGLVQTAYSKTQLGGFVNSLKDVIPSDWNVIDWDQDPDVDATVFYRSNRPGETWVGHKIQGIGHDGARTSKDKAILKCQELLNKQGWWSESSDAMRYILKKANMNVVADESFLKRLLNDPNLQMVDHETYKRKLSNGKTVIETVFGNPTLKGIK